MVDHPYFEGHGVGFNLRSLDSDPDRGGPFGSSHDPFRVSLNLQNLGPVNHPFQCLAAHGNGL